MFYWIVCVQTLLNWTAVSLWRVAWIMALSFKKDLEKYKEIDEDEILNKLSEEELKQLENALEEIDPEVTHIYKKDEVFTL